MSRPRPPWDFGYAPSGGGGDEDDEGPCDVVVATRAATPSAAIEAALRDALQGAEAKPLLDRPPLFWTRVTAPSAAPRAAIAEHLRAASIPVRYVASCAHQSLAVGPPLVLDGATPARPRAWAARAASSVPEPETPGRWFLRDHEGGVAVDRARFGGGAGTRLAVIDDDAHGAELLELDAEVLIGLASAPRHQGHGPLMVAWAAGARGFRGVAPDASPRLYLIPKPGLGAAFLPLAIVRAVDDGADVVVCATYVEGATSPMLDDALAFAARLGRGGRGAAIVLPTGRDASSPSGSVHASFALDLGQPASDPRAFCVAPGARGEGWFFWRDRRGRARPFANRGPAVRWLAPGDDLAYPFSAPERLFHAESSGASAIAAGALLLVLAESPRLRLAELEAVITGSLDPVPPAAPAALAPLADAADALPVGADRDGHSAKHGYGRIHAGRACLAAADPFAAALAAIGEDDAARAWIDARRGREGPFAGRPGAVLRRLYSRSLGRFLARALLADPLAAHGARAVIRHLRLVALRPERAGAHLPGAIVRQIAIVATRLAALEKPRPSPRARAEIEAIAARLAAATERRDEAAALDRRIAAIAGALFVAAWSTRRDNGAEVTRAKPPKLL